MSAKKHIFTQMERNVFKDLLRKYAHIIENKSTTGASKNAKKEAWTKITSEYNASPHVTTQMTRHQLRRLWMNMKQRQREAIIKARLHHFVAAVEGPSKSDANIDASALTIGFETIDTKAESVFTIPAVLPPNYSIPTSRSSTQHPSSLRPSTPCSALPHPPSPTPQYSFQQNMKDIIQKEYEDRKRQADEIHELEKLLLLEKLREAKAKADLAELLFVQQRHPAAAASNVQARVISEEFAMRLATHGLAQSREDELHQTKIEQRQFLANAAQETYLKCKVERESAEELLKCNKAKREQVELRYSLIKEEL